MPVHCGQKLQAALGIAFDVVYLALYAHGQPVVDWDVAHRAVVLFYGIESTADQKAEWAVGVQRMRAFGHRFGAPRGLRCAGLCGHLCLFKQFDHQEYQLAALMMSKRMSTVLATKSEPPHRASRP